MSGYPRRDRVGGLPYSRRSMPGEGYGGGGQQRGYRPTTAPPRSQVVNPWESGVVPMAGAMRGGSGQPGGYQHSSGGRYNQDIGGSINQLSQMGNQESEIALNILNAVLNTSGLDTGNHGPGRMNWGGEPRPSKMRRVDWGDGYESQQRWMGPGMQQGSRKMPGHSWGEGSRHMRGYSRNTFSKQDRRKPTAKKGNVNTGGKNQNAQKKKKDNPAGKATGKNQKKTPDTPAGGGATDQKKKDDDPNVKEAGAESTTTDTKEDIKKETNTDTNQSETTDAVAATKETSDDGEKDNQNKADITAEGKENESNVTEAGNDNQNEEQNESLPVEALHCHICMKNFKTPNGYQNHLYGTNHEKVAEIYIQKSVTLLNFLKAESRLASQQNIVSKSKGQIKSCRKCECPIKGGMPLHIPLRQHKLVVNFKTCSICKLRFATRWKLEKHRLTQQHLKNQYDFKKRIEERNLESAKMMKKEYDFPEMEAMNKVHDAVDQLVRANFTSQAWNPRMIPPYDPAIPIGLNFIERNPQFYCTICSKKILRTSKGALSHFRSRKHYHNYFNLLKNIEGKEKKLGDEENLSDQDPKLAVNEEMEVSEELGKEKKMGDEENQSDQDPKLAVNEEMEVSEELGKEKKLGDEDNQTDQDPKLAVNKEVEVSEELGGEQKQGDEENQADKDTKLEVKEEMEVSEELASLKEALEEVGESFCDVGESMKETLDSAEQQSQDEKLSESSEVEASAPTPSESDSNNQPTEKDTVDLKSTEKDTVDLKSTEKDTVDPKSNEKDAVDPKSAENKTKISKSTENKTEVPKSTENKTEVPKSTEKKTKISKSIEKKTVIPKSAENKTEIAKSTDKTETPSQVEEVSDTLQADQEVVTVSSSEIESTKKKTERKSSTSTPAKKSTSAARPVKSKRAVTITEAEDNASTTSTEIEATEKTVVEKKADIPPRTPRATAKRGRGRGRGGKIKVAKN